MYESSKKNLCPVCDNLDSIFVEFYYNSNNDKYELYSCLNCGVRFWTPFKNPGADWYEKDERYKGANNSPSIEPTKHHKKVLSFLLPLKGKVFDVGCGTGNFLNFAREVGWKVAGIDFDKNAVNTAETYFHLPNIELGTLEGYISSHQEDSKFDLVTFFDVFEHIDNHRDFTEQVKSLLVSNGYIAMSMPYGPGSRWLQPHDFPPRHLTRWSRTSLTNFFENNGFKMLFVRRNPASFFDIVIKLRFKYGSFISFGLVKKVKDTQKPSSGVKVDDKINLVHSLAKLKDLVVFGAPAAFIWIYLWITGSIYTGLFAIAQKK
jgi:2-polyprenyl-3-methyl-5-hydroxy-6-metoxy-1,4-benzoquinol methylase